MRQIIFLLFMVFLVNTVACSQKMGFMQNLTEQESLSGEYATEEFTQGYTGNKLDILVVVDNSISMVEEQEKLGDKIDDFLSTLYDVDWQLAITTTDVSDGIYGMKGNLLNFESLNSYILTPNSPSYQTAFKETIVRSETDANCNQNCPSGDEQPLAATIMAINKRNAQNKGFFRDGADLGVLVLSDEDEKSTGPEGATSGMDVIQHVKRIWGDQKRLLTYGMIIRPGDQGCFDKNNGEGRYGDFVQELSELTGGLTGSICENDYAPTLSIIGEHARKLINGVRLKLYPVEETITVNFSPSHNTSWSLNGKDIVFDNPPPKDTKISVTYMVL